MGKMSDRPSSSRTSGDRWTPRGPEDKDKMIAKLVHDNEILMKEVESLDASLRETQQAAQELLAQKERLESEGLVGQRLLETLDQLGVSHGGADSTARREREELTRKHEADKEFLNTVFRELEAQLAIARSEREEVQSRADRERRASQKRVRELEEALRERDKEALALRAQCDAEKEALVKQFEQRVAGLRLEKEQARLEKQVLRRLERDVGELKALALGSRARQMIGAGDHGLFSSGCGDAARYEPPAFDDAPPAAAPPMRANDVPPPRSPPRSPPTTAAATTGARSPLSATRSPHR